MQHISSSAHIMETCFKQFVAFFPIWINEKHNNKVWSCTTFPHAAQLISFMKHNSRNIPFLFPSLRCSIEIYWFVASYKYFIFHAIYFKQFVSLVCAAPIRQTLNLSVCYLRTSESLNRLRSFMDWFVHYIHRKVCRYQVFNIITQYIWKIMC